MEGGKEDFEVFWSGVESRLLFHDVSTQRLAVQSWHFCPTSELMQAVIKARRANGC